MNHLVGIFMANFTPREKQVISLIAEGNTVPEIATELDLSIHTVRSYTKSIMQKLDAKNIAHAIALVYQNEEIDDSISV